MTIDTNCLPERNNNNPADPFGKSVEHAVAVDVKFVIRFKSYGSGDVDREMTLEEFKLLLEGFCAQLDDKLDYELCAVEIKD